MPTPAPLAPLYHRNMDPRGLALLAKSEAAPDRESIPVAHFNFAVLLAEARAEVRGCRQRVRVERGNGNAMAIVEDI